MDAGVEVTEGIEESSSVEPIIYQLVDEIVVVVHTHVDCATV